MRSFVKSILVAAVCVCILTLLFNVPAPFKVAAQQATGSVPTVTGTPLGPYIVVTYEDQINVRAGPNSYTYPLVGSLLSGASAPALARSPGNDWIEISFPGAPGGVGWVFASYVRLVAFSALPIAQAPPTPTPATTPTINPTVVASFLTPIPPTRIPTFTAPSPLQIPTYQSAGAQTAGPVPMGLIIILLGLIGGFGALISFLRGR